MNHHIVVWDPEGIYWEGSIVDHPVAMQVQGRGGVALPADPSLFGVAGNGGYFKRSWGAGWPCDHSVPKLFCPLSVFLMRDSRVVHWAARLVPDEKFPAGAPDSPGTLALSAMPARANTYMAPLTPRTQPRRIRDLGEPDKNGGWTISGNAFANVAMEGNHAFGLYGAAQGVRVAWAALSAVRG